MSMDEKMMHEIARFWSKVSVARIDAGDKYCWVWNGAKDHKGYGQFRMSGGKLRRSTRFLWEIYNGEIPEEHQVCHRCDNPSCVRPSHLFLGTNAENVADRELKGRGVRQFGEAHHTSKLTKEKVASIRLEIMEPGVKQRDLAEKYGVSQHAIWNVVNNNTWVRP